MPDDDPGAPIDGYWTPTGFASRDRMRAREHIFGAVRCLGGWPTGPLVIRQYPCMAASVDDADEHLRRVIRDSGGSLDAPDLIQVWDAFRSFLDVAFETDSDGVLVQGGVYSFGGPERYYFDFLRQLQHPGDDEYEQVHCEFQYEPTAALRGLGTFSEWWFSDDGQDLDEFLTRMRSRPEFAAVLPITPIEVAIYQDGT